MHVSVGTGPDSWGVWFPQDDKQIAWNQYLDEAAEAGYEWTELGPHGYLPTDIVQLKNELSSRGLKTAGTFCMDHYEDESAWPSIETKLSRICDSVGVLGGQYVVLIDDLYTNPRTGELLRPAELDDEGWKRMADALAQADRQVASAGLTAVFHPHADSHVEYESQIERLLADTDLALCLDTGHHDYRGGDSVAFYRKHHARIPYLHLKSVDAEKRAQVLRDRTPFATAVGEEVFVEPAKGSVDFLAFRDAMRDADFDGFAIVEQDMYPAAPGAPLPIAKRTREYLREIGIG